VGPDEQPPADERLLAMYRQALPHVYGYLLPRCGSAAVAEDLAAETFEAAVAAIRQRDVPDLSIAWLLGIARHKLADHWRRSAREQRGLAAVTQDCIVQEDPWEGWLDAQLAHAALARLPVPQRAALTLRYLDGLPVAEVAAYLGRSVHATETLLVRSRAALRSVYLGEVDDGH
jgi:RNA polymerase sigma-70 factor (ECF subfamily)